MLSPLVDQALRDLRRPTLVLGVEGALTGHPPREGVEYGELGRPLPREGGWGSVVLVAPDAAALRRAVSALPFLGRARAVVCVVRDRTAPIGLVPRPGWPALRQLVARVGDDGGSVTRVELTRGLPVAEVLLEVARQAGTPLTAGPSGVYVAQPPGALPPPVDARLVVAPDAPGAADPAAKVPADLWLGGGPGSAEEHPVTGRPLAVLADDGIGPLDEAVLNPIGFRARVGGPVVDLPAANEPGPGLVEALREHRGVRVPAEGRERLVAGLAMAGVPLVPAVLSAATAGLSDRSRALLGDDVADAITAPVDLDDPLARERHSVVLRGAALRRHSTYAWRVRLAERAGIRGPGGPDVEILGTATPAQAAALRLARSYSGADRVALGPAEMWAAPGTPVDGPVLVTRGRAAGGSLYLTHALE